MATIDAIAEARLRYLASSKTRLDWIRYVRTVEALRAQREGGRRSG